MMKYRISTASGASSIDAELGIVHADTIVATTADTLRLTPPSPFTLTVNGKSTASGIAELGLPVGKYDAKLIIQDGKGNTEQPVKLILVDPSKLQRRFGARHGALEYDLPVIVGPGKTTDWQKLWKTNDVADIVVDFDAPYKFVFWRGMSFAPSWFMDNVYTCNFFAETVEPGVFRDCCEMMSDRECRYIHARVIHSSPARVVIHWRMPLNDSAYQICRDQWVDEIYYIYPDGVVCRNVTVHFDPQDESAWTTCSYTGKRIPCRMIESNELGKRAFNDMEFITVNAPGATSDDNTPLNAMTLLDGKDFSRSYTWPKPNDSEPLPTLSEYIFRMNYNERPGVFIASPGIGLKASFCGNDEGMKYQAAAEVKDDQWITLPELPSNFIDCLHWPITRGHGTEAITDVSVYNDRPTHTFLGFANNLPTQVTSDGAVTWRWLSGIAPEDDNALRARVNAWLTPVELQNACYDPAQAAYIVKESKHDVVIANNSDQPVIRPTFVLESIAAQPVKILLNDNPLNEHEFFIGLENAFDAPRTVITLNNNLSAQSSIKIVFKD